MVRQERAERTRGLLLRGAAAAFAQDGYAGTSLSRISKAVGVTMGALTFHFPAKSDLAEAICGLARAETRAVVGRAREAAESPLQAVVDITYALAGLLAGSSTVRAAWRLSREGELWEAEWSAGWEPDVTELLDRAGREEELRRGVDPAAVAALVRLLLAGLEAVAPPVESGRPGGGAELAAVWGLVLPGVTAPGATLRPGGSPGARGGSPERRPAD